MTPPAQSQNEPAAAADAFTDFAAMVREADLVAADVLTWACHESRAYGKPLHDLLLERVPAVERELWRLLARYMGVPFDDLAGRARSTDLTRRIPSSMAFGHHLAPLAIEEGVLVVSVARPAALGGLDEIAAITGMPVRAVLSPPSHLDRFIQLLYGLGAETVDSLSEETPQDHTPIRILEAESHALSDGLDGDRHGSITAFVNRLLIQAIKDGASDIHIEPYEHRLRVRFRLDGQLQEVPVPPSVKQFEAAIISRVKVLGNLDIAEKRLCQDGQMRLTVLGRSVDVRISVLPTIYGEGVVLRLLDRQVQFRSLDTIGMDAAMLAAYRAMLERPGGLILVTGPTGSGKTTTLYSSMTHVNRPRRKIITIEDPVEYRLEGITQIQVKESIGLSFSNLLRSILRHDPDVIMVGEIRDSQTANMALSAAMTGHLVFASVHTNDAPTTVARLRNMGAPSYLIAAGLEVVLAQRLVRRLCPSCRQEAPPPAPKLLEDFPVLAGRTLWRAVGCEHCRQSGYQGRTGVFECLLANEEIRQMTLSEATVADLRAAAIRHGMVPLRQAGMRLVSEGATTLDEVLRVTGDLHDDGRGPS
ncbi:MAG: type II/IV secretion system protein [Planctomycetes bacterium]|nr:type II/IV secretion system protein [Planctomycetota bacterium]